MLTFPPPTLVSVSLVPLDSPETGGRFRVWLLSENDTALLWDRKAEGGFPEMKDLVCKFLISWHGHINAMSSETTSEGLYRPRT